MRISPYSFLDANVRAVLEFGGFDEETQSMAEQPPLRQPVDRRTAPKLCTSHESEDIVSSFEILQVLAAAYAAAQSVDTNI